MLKVGKRVILVEDNQDKDYVFLGAENLEVGYLVAFFLSIF